MKTYSIYALVGLRQEGAEAINFTLMTDGKVLYSYIENMVRNRMQNSKKDVEYIHIEIDEILTKYLE